MILNRQKISVLSLIIIIIIIIIILLLIIDDDSRVLLSTVKYGDKKILGSDYINASFVSSALDDHYRYIAAQGPTRETVPDFIRMIIEYNIKVVICACNEYEGQRVFKT